MKELDVVVEDDFTRDGNDGFGDLLNLDDEEIDDIASSEDESNDEGHEGKIEESSSKNNEAEVFRSERDRLAAERDSLIAERDNIRREVYEAKKQTLVGALNQFKSEYERESHAITELEQQLARAYTEGNGDVASDLTGKIAEKRRRIDSIRDDYANVNLQLNQLPAPEFSQEASPSYVKEDPTKKMASEWLSSNSWYNDPQYMDKKEKAEEAYQLAISKGYSPASYSFWKFIDKEVESFVENKTVRRRTPPAVRPVSNSGVSNPMNKESKIDKIIDEQTDKFMRIRSSSTAAMDDKRYQEMRAKARASIERQIKSSIAQKRKGA